MKYAEFKNGLENGDFYPIYIIEGEDAFFREKAVNLLKNKFVSEPAVNFASFDGDFELNTLLSSLLAYPFLSEKRMTLVREFYPKADFFKGGIKEFIDNPPETSALVIVNEKSSELQKRLKDFCYVECCKADVSLLVKWIKGQCTASNVGIEQETAKTLAEFCQFDMTRIENETHKLIAFAGNGGKITDLDVKENVSMSVEYKIYELTDFIGKKRFDKALSVIKDMMSKGETSQRILVSVYNYFRRLLLVAITDGTNMELAQLLGVKEFAVKKTREQSEMFKKRSLKSAVDALSDADYKIKSGLIDANEQMWITVFKIMTENI